MKQFIAYLEIFPSWVVLALQYTLIIIAALAFLMLMVDALKYIVLDIVRMIKK